MIKVFISYKTEDLSTARGVKGAIEQHADFETYLDRVDDSLLKDNPKLAQHLLRRIDECDQLLAVVGETTVRSWWVPWEIGVGSAKHYFLATYLRGQVDLPSYLERWPILRSPAHINKYCELSRRVSQERHTFLAEEDAPLRREALKARTARDFHTELRRALGQSHL